MAYHSSVGCDLARSTNRIRHLFNLPPYTRNHHSSVARALDLELQSNSRAGYDGVGKDGVRVQIKGRRVTPTNNSRQLSAIRKYAEKDFDVLVAVIYDESFNIIEALLIPHEVVGEYASFREHVNAHILILKGPILSDPRVQSIKEALCS